MEEEENEMKGLFKNNIDLHFEFLYLKSIKAEESLAILRPSLQTSPGEGFHHIGRLIYKELAHNCMQDHSSQSAIKYS